MIQFHILFETLFIQHLDNDIWNIFTPISGRKLENLQDGLEIFIKLQLSKKDFTGTHIDITRTASLIASKIKIVKKTLANVFGVLLLYVF